MSGNPLTQARHATPSSSAQDRPGSPPGYHLAHHGFTNALTDTDPHGRLTLP